MNNTHQELSNENVERMEKQIREQMNIAFFDLIDEKVNSEKPDYEWITKLYQEIRDRLCGFLKKDSKTRKKIMEEFDVELFNQMITNDVFDQESLLKLVNNTFSWIEKLQAPSRDETTNESKKKVLNSISADPTKIISNFLKETHTCIDTIEIDFENYMKKIS